MAATLLEAMALLPLRPLHAWTRPDVPVTPYPSGRAWKCDTGRHRYHRSKDRARWCAWAALPMTFTWREIGEPFDGPSLVLEA